MGGPIHIAEVAALLLVTYSLGWAIGFAARRATLRVPAGAEIPAARLELASACARPQSWPRPRRSKPWLRLPSRWCLKGGSRPFLSRKIGPQQRCHLHRQLNRLLLNPSRPNLGCLSPPHRSLPFRWRSRRCRSSRQRQRQRRRTNSSSSAGRRCHAVGPRRSDTRISARHGLGRTDQRAPRAVARGHDG